MSNTPRTDAAFAEHGKITFQGEQYVMAEFAHRLERENAELRIERQHLMTALLDIKEASEGQVGYVKSKLTFILRKEAQP